MSPIWQTILIVLTIKLVDSGLTEHNPTGDMARMFPICQAIFILLTIKLVATSATQVGQNTTVRRSKRAVGAADAFLRRWPDSTVFYTMDPQLEPSSREDILHVMDHIERNTCVRFVKRTNQNDYVTYVRSNICREAVGRQGGQQLLHINTTLCGYYGFYLHSTTQTLGFYHEHQRADRDMFVTVFEGNIDPASLESYMKLNQNLYINNSPYDVDSVMHYGSYQRSINGKPTMLTKDGAEIRGWDTKNQLSEQDKLSINAYYGCPRHFAWRVNYWNRYFK